MARKLNLADIQGNVLRGYGLPKSRFICLHVDYSADGRSKGRDFVDRIRELVTNALPWDSSETKKYPKSPTGKVKKKPEVTLNVAFTFEGLRALGVPIKTLQSMPEEFIEGMRDRANLLGDDFCSPARPHAAKLDHWDPIWSSEEDSRQVHILVSLNAQMDKHGNAVPALQEMTDRIFRMCEETGGMVKVLAGHGREGLAQYQEASTLVGHDPLNGKVKATPKEHFGFTDGFGDPVFDGQYPDGIDMTEAIGGGKILPDGTWAPLATGEFLLGYPDEAQEVPPASMPLELTHNGTFMAYRKIHQNVREFREYREAEVEKFARVTGLTDLEEARETLAAKFIGRWENGVPLMAAPTYAEMKKFVADEAVLAAPVEPVKARLKVAKEEKDEAKIKEIEAELDAVEQPLKKFQEKYYNFRYNADPEGAKCPVTAHMRRANTRDSLDPTGTPTNQNNSNGSVINNRRRILRRGMPYGLADSPDGEHGVIFLALCASLFRQFEFVQQQWIQYGLDFNVGNDTCPVLGNHDEGSAKFVIPGNATTKPYICARLPQFVEVRGGSYFFIPSITALRMIGMGTIDPT